MADLDSRVVQFQAMLAGLRQQFLKELDERCGQCEGWTLMLEKQPDDQETLASLHREVHSIKGGGGTHGLPLVTTLCHHLEDRLAYAVNEVQGLPDACNDVLALLDMIRVVAREELTGHTQHAAVDTQLASLLNRGEHRALRVLVGDDSVMLHQLCHMILKKNEKLLTYVDDGIAAITQCMHQPFDLLVLGRELKGIGGVGVLAAVRAVQGRNQQTPAVLVSSRAIDLPALIVRCRVLPRDNQLIPQLTRLFSEFSLSMPSEE